ncbi:MAG: hypothetical protein CVV27_17210 [Candidatus Melainabacteria bacterium HGW-Melainabacteria-1]|nr:MAG: hypothetical protein CVV27_17210 [Candidatus Melainabacteria bacterium HGW-Melainabacteria-1]
MSRDPFSYTRPRKDLASLSLLMEVTLGTPPPRRRRTLAPARGLRLLADGLCYGLPAGLLGGSLFEPVWLAGLNPGMAANLPGYYAFWALFGTFLGLAVFVLGQQQQAALPKPTPAATQLSGLSIHSLRGLQAEATEAAVPRRAPATVSAA